jgi:hypothetical protein
MSLSRKEIEKRKAREKAVRKKVLAQRDQLRMERKLVEEERQREYEMWKLEHGATKPALPGNPEAAAKAELERARVIAEKLQKNLEILKALEAEYDREQAVRTELNEKLEDEGYKTMKEKMAALHEKARKMKEDAERMAEYCSEKAAEAAAEQEKS